MAAPVDIQVTANEYYETEHIPETISDPHPHPPMRDSKIIKARKVSEIMVDTSQVVCTWPSFDSLALYFLTRGAVLPEFDLECTLTEAGAIRLIKRHIGLIDLYFNEKLKEHRRWLHDQASGDLDAAMGAIGVDRRIQQHRNYIRLDQIYEIDYTALPQPLRDAIGCVRVARITGEIDCPNGGCTIVEVGTPSMKSLQEFLSSEFETELPEFNRRFTFGRICARLFFLRILPMELCIRLRNYREFWIDELVEEIFKELYDDADFDASAAAGGDYATAGSDADVDDASAGAGGDADVDDASGGVDVDDASAGAGGGADVDDASARAPPSGDVDDASARAPPSGDVVVVDDASDRPGGDA